MSSLTIFKPALERIEKIEKIINTNKKFNNTTFFLTIEDNTKGYKIFNTADEKDLQHFETHNFMLKLLNNYDERLEADLLGTIINLNPLSLYTFYCQFINNIWSIRQI